MSAVDYFKVTCGTLRMAIFLAGSILTLSACGGANKGGLTKEQLRGAKAYAEMLCAPSIDETHAGLQKFFVQIVDITASQGEKDSAQQEGLRIAREKGCVE